MTYPRLFRISLGCCLVFVFLRTCDCRLGEPKPFMLKLRKAHANSNSSNSTNASEKVDDHGSGHYIGDIQIGTPAQTLSVAFLTTTDLIVLPGSNCESDSCRQHHSYSTILSETAIDINRDGKPVDPEGGRRAPPGKPRDITRVDYHASHGKGTEVTGHFVKDKLCLGDRLGNTKDLLEPLCSTVDLLSATKEGDEVFGSRPEDGMIGISPKREEMLESEFSFLQDITAAGLKSQFGFFVEDDGHAAEITFGGYDARRVEASFDWVPVVAPEEGQWMIDIVAVKVGSHTIPSLCSSGSTPCVGLFSTGTPSIMAPEGDSKTVLDAIESGKSDGLGCELPDLTFELAGGVSLKLAVEDYAGPRCSPEVGAHHMGVQLAGRNLWLLGEPLFRRYYTVFDWQKMSVGFARSKLDRNCLRLQQAGFPLDQFKCVWPKNADEL